MPIPGIMVLSKPGTVMFVNDILNGIMFSAVRVLALWDGKIIG
jgi:hypothetical protein